MRIVGLMSGTSMDGIDAVLAEVEPHGAPPRLRAQILAQHFVPYDVALRDTLTAEHWEPGLLARLHYQLAERFAASALAVLDSRRASLIGSHGQTVSHLPAANASLQLGEPAVIAERTGITTVGNFRAADLAAGGQGAPLVPYADFHLFAHPRETRVCLNLGGIANVTILPAGGSLSDVRGFDTGPGNMVLDACVALLTRGQDRQDVDGRRAARGRVDESVLADLLNDPYFIRQPPKSCGREEFGAAFAARAVTRGLSSDDLCATLTALTAESVARALRPFQPIDRVLVSGGGIHNPTLMGHLQERLPAVPVETIDAHGYSSDFKEALAFALLAFAAWKGWPANVPSCTGARRAVVLGQIAPGDNYRELWGEP
jgi:anhydro-N-acetylmuramic acid kinase